MALHIPFCLGSRFLQRTAWQGLLHHLEAGAELPFATPGMSHPLSKAACSLFGAPWYHCKVCSQPTAPFDSFQEFL